MPRLLAADTVHGNIGSFNFSGIRPESLGQTEYTLVTIILDQSGSVGPYSGELLNMLQAIVEACKKSPRADYLILRYVRFNESISEDHGFTPLSQIQTTDYKEPHCGGGTALYDAAFSGIGAVNVYGKVLADKDYVVNAITFIVTDGDDNGSKMRPQQVKEEVEQATLLGEFIESHVTVLIGINVGNSPTLQKYLNNFKDQAGLSQYIDAGTATPENLAKLAKFVSTSISSQSSSLGTGGPSAPVTF